MKTCVGTIAWMCLAASAAHAQDVKGVLTNASKAMGVETLNAMHYYGTAACGNLGQNKIAPQPWSTRAPTV